MCTVASSPGDQRQVNRYETESEKAKSHRGGNPVAFLFSLVDGIRKNLNELYQDFIEKSSQDYGSIRKIQDGQAILLGYSWGGFPVRHVQDDG